MLIAKDGTERIVADSAAPMVNSTGDIIGVVMVFPDITEKRKTEARLQGVQKMEAIATLLFDLLQIDPKLDRICGIS